jgi:flagellar hook-associated protein 1
MIRNTFLGIQVAKSGLMAARGGLDTTGHNISNAGTEGYSRQRVNIRASFPLNFPGPFVTLRPGQIGTGTEIYSITRARSAFIEAQIHHEGGTQQRFQTVSEGLRSVEDIFGEPTDAAFNGLTEQFYSAWEDLSNDPESISARTNLKEAADAVASFVNQTDFKLKQEVVKINEQLRGKVEEINSLAAQIADVNKQIQMSESGGSMTSIQANDLKDRRDSYIESLSKLVNARVLQGRDGSLNVLIEGHPLVSDSTAHRIGLRITGNDPQRPIIEFTASRIPLSIRSGEVDGLLKLRDREIPEVVRGFSKLVTTFTNRVNEAHIKGYGLDGNKGRAFFDDRLTRRVLGNVVLPAGTTLYTTIDSLGITSGDFFIQGERIVIEDKEVLPGQALTLGQLLERIRVNSIDVRPELDTSGGFPRIVINQFNPPDENDPLNITDGTSNFFETAGLKNQPVQDMQLEPPYGNSLLNLRVNPAVASDLRAIAAAGDDGLGFPGPGDNRTALEIAGLKNESNSSLRTTIGEFFQSVIARLGSRAQDSQRNSESQKLVVEQLDNRRQQISGVNLDEEAVQLIKYQKAFEASARALTTVDDALDVIINRMGMVGR